MSTELSPEEREAMEAAWFNWRPSSVPSKLGVHANAWRAAREYSKKREEELEREHADLLERTHDVIWKRFEQREEKLREALRTARRRIRQVHELVAAVQPRRLREITTDAICEIDDVLAENGDTDD